MKCWFSLLLAVPALAALVPYDPTPGAVTSGTYQVTVDGQSVPVEKFKDISYARFSFNGQATVTVSVAAPFGDYVLCPVRLQIPVARRGSELSFTLARSRKLVLQCEGLEKLFLFADAPEAHPPQLGASDVVNVIDFVSDRTGATLQRENLQRALDAIAARPKGGVLYFPAGTYLTGTLVIHSNTTVYLESGALLLGTANPKDYYVAASEPPRTKPGTGTGALLYFVDAENSRLIGRGTVAAQGTKIRQLVKDHPRICNFIRCKNCEIADVVIRDSGGFNIHALRCENLLLHGYKIINDLALSNQDGTDPDSSRHIVVDDVFMYTSDDAIAVKADLGLCEDVVVKNCVFWTKKSALKVGSDPYFGARAIVFENNDVLHADRALALYARMGFIENVRFMHNTAEFVGDDIKQQTIVFLVSKLGPDGESSAGKKSPYTGYIKDVLVEGFLSCQPSAKPSVIRGDGPGHEVSNVGIRDYYLGGRPVKSAADAVLEIGVDVRNISFAITGAPPPEAAAMRLPAWAK